MKKDQKLLPLANYQSVVRFGSTTDVPDSVTNGGARIELNTVQAIKNSCNKLLMKQCFTNAGVKTAQWAHQADKDSINNLEFPIVAKHIFGSRNRGNYKLNSFSEFESWKEGKTLSNYIFEKFYNYSREYRLHVSKDGCFYTCRKVLKNDTPAEQRWFRNDSNSNWIVETNELFDKPVNWDKVIDESVKALNAVGLDFGAVDLRIQSRLDKDDKERLDPDFIVIEINSAPSFGEVTLQKYIEEIPRMLDKKYNETIK